MSIESKSFQTLSILFQDFEVGKIYKKKIILTNISYMTNHCKFLGVSAQLKDFISIK